MTMKNLKSHLKMLELEDVPDTTTLQQSYLRLLKKYHPDRNRDRNTWAHEKTRTLIDSYQSLKTYIDEKSTSQSRKATGETMVRPTGVRTYKEDSSSQIRMQPVLTKMHNFMIPVHRIIKIITFQHASIQTTLLGQFCVFENDLYSLIYPDTANERVQPLFILLYSNGTEKNAYVFESDAVFSEILTVSVKEVIYHKTEGSFTGTIYRDGIVYQTPTIMNS